MQTNCWRSAEKCPEVPTSREPPKGGGAGAWVGIGIGWGGGIPAIENKSEIPMFKFI